MSIENIGLALGGGKDAFASIQRDARGPNPRPARAASPAMLAHMGFKFEKVTRG